MLRLLRIIAITCLAACLFACASNPVVQSPAEFSGTHGYVYVNLPKNDPFSRLVLQSTRNKSKYDLLRRADTATGAFGIWIPEGTYLLTEWNGHKLAGYPQIKIVAGHVTDLGSLIPLNIGGYELIILPVRHRELEGLVQVVINEYRTYLASPEPIRWEPSSLPHPINIQQTSSGLGLIADLLLAYEQKVNKPSIKQQLREATTITELFTLAKSITPPAYAEPAIDDANNIYYSADFGQLRVRSLHGTWSGVDVGTLRPITAVEILDQTIVTGSDNGILRISSDQGRSWKQIKAFASNEVITDIDHVNNMWIIITAQQVRMPNGYLSVSAVKVRKATKGDFSDIEEIKNISINSSGFAGKGVLGESDGNYYYVSAFPDLHRLNMDTGKWKIVTPPTQVHGFHVNPGSAIAAFKIMGAFSKLFVSEDHGDTWRELDAPPYVILDINMASTSKGIASRWRMDAFSGAIEVLDYNAVGDRWIKKNEAPAGCITILNDPRHQPSYCVTRGGSILALQANKWVVEFAAE